MNTFYQEEESINGHVKLNKVESHHCINVVRKTIGEEIKIINGRGNEKICQIKSIKDGIVNVDV